MTIALIIVALGRREVMAQRGGHLLWLPTIKNMERPETCNYAIQWDVPDPYVVKLDEPVTVAFSWDYDGGGDNDPTWYLWAFAPGPDEWTSPYYLRNPEHDGLTHASESFVIPPDDGPEQAGEYQWALRAICLLPGSTIPTFGPPVDLTVMYN